MTNKLIIAALAVLGTTSVVAQDVNFSQINQMPTLANPANTGAFEKDWRVGGIFRNTSYTATQTFTTGAFSVEKRIKSDGFISENDVLGVGVYGLTDKSNGGALTSSYIGFSTAFGKALNLSGTSRLAVGVQGVWATRRLDVNKLTFEDQFTSGGFEAGGPSADSYRGGSSNYLDLNIGIGYTLATEKQGLNLGAALYHAGKPKEQFWKDTYQLPVRYTLNAGAYFAVANKDRIYVDALTNYQSNADEYLLGAYFSKNVQLDASDMRLNIGSYYRVNSAIIPYIGLQYSNWKGGLSYDVASGSIRKASANRKSLELSVTALF